MYQIVSTLNGFIKEEILLNPFDFISDNQLILMLMLFTYLIGGMILHIISFSMCGVFYNRGQAPVLGSIGYMMAFNLNVWLLINLSKLFNSILTISIIYFIVVIFIFILLNKIKKLYAGEYFVAGELARRGFTAAVPMSNTKDFDILAINRESYKQFAIQVKTTRYKKSMVSWSKK